MDPLITKIEDLTEFAGLEQETRTLLKLAVEAQRTGKMPDLRKLQPTHFHDCTGTTNGVGKITAPQRIG
jgi:hypothetical protein